MPVYQYQGNHYELADGLSNEEAIGKIKSHLSGQPAKVEMSASENPLVGGLETLASMGTGAIAQPIAGLAGVAKAAIHGADEDAGAREGANAVSSVQDALTYQPRTKTGQYYTETFGNALHKPIEWAGKAGEMVGGNAGEAIASAGTEIGMNFLPLLGATKVPGLVRRAFKGKEPLPVPELPPTVAPEARMPEQMELPLQNSPQQVAEMQGAAMGQRDMFAPTNQEVGLAVDASPIEPQVALRKAMDAEAAGKQAEAAFWKERAMEMVREARAKESQNTLFTDRNGNTGEGQFSPYEQPKDVPPPIDEMQQHPLFDQPEEGRVANPYEAVTGDWRIDENGMPIKADLSMDVANAGDPLQRNLWGDELPQKHEQEGIPLTEAIDSMPWAARRGAINRELKGAVDSSGTLEGAKLEANSPFKAPANQRGHAQWINDLAEKFVREVPGGFEAVDKDGNVIGRLRDNLERGQAEQLGEAANVDIVKVDPAYQGKGVGSALYKAFHDKHEGQVLPSGKTSQPAWDLWKRNYPEKVDLFVQSEAQRIRDGATSSMVLGNISDPQVRSRVAEASQFTVPKGQRGSAPILNDLAKKVVETFGGRTASETTHNMPAIPREPVPNRMATPTSPETIARKQELRSKVDASKTLKDIAPEYSSITTPQEAMQLAKDYTKDINVNPARDVTISGINGMTMFKRDNPLLNYTRYALQDMRNIATQFSKEFVTSKTGVANLYKDLPKADRIQAVEVLKRHADMQIELTPENIRELGLKPAQEAYILSVRKAMDAMWSVASDALLSSGRNVFEKRAGYLPTVWTGAYKGLIGKMENGVFSTIEVPQSDTRAGYKAAVNAALKANPGSTVQHLPRVGMKQIGRSSNLFSGFNDIMNVIAKNDPRFAKLQMNAQMKINEANHGLMNFDVHEQHKTGVKGGEGESRTKSRAENADDLGKALINYLEQGSEYYSAQKALNNIGEVLTSPDVAHLPNTIKYIEDHVKHVTGQDLNPIGAALNWTIDGLFKAVGIGPKVPTHAMRGLKTAMGIHMMGIYNPTFTALQLTQLVTGALPELAKVGSKLNLKGSMADAALSGPRTYAALSLADRFGKPIPDFIQPHMKAAYQYAKDNGIMSFSELEIANDATRNKWVNRAQAAGSLPIAWGEKSTRPPVFLTFADMFHRFGLDDAEAFMAAQHATNISMGDYHPAERPRIYSQLGVVGEFGGALTTYKHNVLTNLATRAKDVAIPDGKGNRMYLAGAAALASAAFFQGITGQPGYNEADAMFQWATSLMGKRQGLTETALNSVPEWGKSGVLSASTGLDFQSRLSMSNVLPEFKAGSLSPQMSVLGDMLVKAATYGQYKDQQSFNDLMASVTPSGLKGLTEETTKVDKNGYVENAAGELMYPEPRTDKERLIRKAFSIRPLRETLEQKDTYVDSKSVQEREKAQNTIALRFRQAFASGDQKGMDTLAQMYYDKEGDPQVLLNAPALQQQIQRANQTQRERLTGSLSATMKSLNRYRDMNDGK